MVPTTNISGLPSDHTDNVGSLLAAQGGRAEIPRPRSEALLEIPTIRGFVSGYEASAWFGLGAPKAMPVDIVDKLNKEINFDLSDPKIKASPD